MTIERQAKQLVKRANRRADNAVAKELKAHNRQVDLVTLGETVVTTEVDGVKTYDLPTNPRERIVTPPRLSWLGGKTYTQSGDSRSGRSGHAPEHREAFVENASRMFTKEVDKALLPEPDLAEVAQTL